MRIGLNSNASGRLFVRLLKSSSIERGTKLPQEVANAVVQEYINPELADIERRLGIARKKLTTKVGAGVALGGSTVTAGAIASIPLVLATGVAAMATSLPQVYKYFEDRNEVQLSDLYFLWKARVKHKA